MNLYICHVEFVLGQIEGFFCLKWDVILTNGLKCLCCTVSLIMQFLNRDLNSVSMNALLSEWLS